MCVSVRAAVAACLVALLAAGSLEYVCNVVVRIETKVGIFREYSMHLMYPFSVKAGLCFRGGVPRSAGQDWGSPF